MKAITMIVKNEDAETVYDFASHIFEYQYLTIEMQDVEVEDQTLAYPFVAEQFGDEDA